MGLHATQSKMPWASMDACFIAHSLSIVSNFYLEQMRQKSHTHCNVLRIRMAEGIRQRFTADAVHFIAHKRMNLSNLAFTGQLETGYFALTELRLRMTKHLDKVVLYHGSG